MEEPKKKTIKHFEIIKNTIKDLEIEDFELEDLSINEIFAIVETLNEQNFNNLAINIENKYKNFCKYRTKAKNKKGDEENFINDSECNSEESLEISEDKTTSSIDEIEAFNEEDWEVGSSEESLLNKPADEVQKFLSKK